MAHFTYLLYLLLFTLLPTAILFFFFWKMLRQYFRVYLFTGLGSLVFSLPWDYFAIHRWQIWSFPEKTITSVYLLGVPLEEYFFITLVTWLLATITLISIHYLDT